MARTFVSSFLLPLVRGGRLHVGRPLGAQALARLVGELVERPRDAGEAEDVAALAAHRRAVAGRYLPDAAPPPLDEVTLRLGAAVHDLLVLVHPGIDGPRVAHRQARIAAAAHALASVEAPRSAVEAVNRHSLLARLPEIGRTDSTVTFWLGRQTFVGRVPPPRVTAWPALRRVRVDAVRRAWLREIGVPAVAREAVLALATASPLGEALDPLRLEPPLAWSRILSALRWPALARIVAGRLLEVGALRAGDSLAAALLRFASAHEPAGGVAVTPGAVAFALRFLAHLVWLDVLFAPGAGASAARVSVPGTGAPVLGGGLGAMVTAAHEVDPTLVWPADVSREGDLGRAFGQRLAALAGLASSPGGPGLPAARAVAAFAAGREPVGQALQSALADGDAAVPIHI